MTILEHVLTKGPRWTPLLVLICGLLGTTAAWMVLHNTQKKEADEKFQKLGDELLEAIERRMSNHNQILLNGAGFFKASNHVSRDDWRRFVESMDLGRNFPGVLGLGYSQVVKPDQLKVFEDSLRKEGFSQFALKPAGKRELYTSIIYLEPFVGRNMAALGFDMFSEPHRRAAMTRAVETGTAQLSSKVTLVQEIDADPQPGLLMYVPVYESGVSLDSPEKRWDALRGFVYSPYRVNSLMQALLDGQELQIDFALYTGTMPSAEQLIYTSNPRIESADLPLRSEYIEMFGQPFYIDFYPQHDFHERFNQGQGLLLTLGFVISVLLFILTQVVASGQRRAIKQLMVLEKSESRLGAIAMVTNDVIWELDVESRILSHNQRGGISQLPKNLTIYDWLRCVHPDDKQQLIEGFLRALDGNDLTWVAEFRYFDRYNNIGILESKAAFLRNQKGKAIHVVGGAQDLTRRRKMQSAMMNMAASVAELEDEQFFTALLRNLVNGLEADGGCIAKIDETSPSTAITLAVIVDGEHISNFTYPIVGSPCENLLSNKDCFIPDNLSQNFPKASGLPGIQSRSYVGGQLIDEQGIVIGFIYVLFRAPVERTDLMTSVLQVFAVRAAAEIRRIEAEQKLREQANLLDHAKESIIVLDLELNIRFWNKGAEDMYGVSRENAIGHSVRKFYADASALSIAFTETLREDHFSGEFQQAADSKTSTVLVDENWTLIRDASGSPKSILKVGIDVTDRHEAEKQIKRLAYFDTLTGLPNRRLFMERLKEALENSASAGKFSALLFIDLDNFKNLNDLHGHLNGDELLVSFSRTLSKAVGKHDTVARLGGDEFVIIISSLDANRSVAIERASQAARTIIKELEKPLEIQDSCVYATATASIGITVFNDASSHLGELLRQADMAMYEAKDFGRNTYRVYNAESDDAIITRTMLSTEFKRALENGEFELWYQTQLDANEKVYGAEALLRWRHPSRGLIPPSDFIPLAERSRFIVELGRWVLDTACHQLSQWEETLSDKPFKLSVNVSVQQLRQDNFVEEVLQSIQRHGVVSGRLVLEVTEGVLDEASAVISKKLHTLREKGVLISLDDFGTGYSSLSRLKRMPFDEIKIDKSFISEVPRNEDDSAIVMAILALGKAMHMRVVAEGVETAEQLTFLKHHGCEAFQGYYYSVPTPNPSLDRCDSVSV